VSISLQYRQRRKLKIISKNMFLKKEQRPQNVREDAHIILSFLYEYWDST